MYSGKIIGPTLGTGGALVLVGTQTTAGLIVLLAVGLFISGVLLLRTRIRRHDRHAQ